MSDFYYSQVSAPPDAAARQDQAQNLRELMDKRSRGTKLITIASGKGGVGKSSLCVNLAMALSGIGVRVLVVDADFGLANIDVMLGVNTRYNLSHLLRGEKTLYDIIQEGHKGVRFISGGSGVYELLRMDESQIRSLAEALLAMPNPPDIILLDAGAGISDNVVQLALASTETIVVTTPEPTAILDAYALVKTILRLDSVHKLYMVMNKCENRREAVNAVSAFQQVIRQYLQTEVESLGYVLTDPEVLKSIKQQTPVLVSSPDGPFARDIQAIARRMLDIPYQPPSRAGLLARIFNRKSG